MMPLAGNTTSPLLVIIGPTAVGKTSLSLQIAQLFSGEVISADSRLVYKGMDIGTAKPSQDEQVAVPHHLIDILTPDSTLALAQYQKMTYRTIDATHERGNLPMLVGGTGQYVSAVIEGWGIPEVPPNPALRAELEQFAANNGSLALWNRLEAHDLTAAERIHPNNVRRVIRALEVFLESGTPISVLQRKSPPPFNLLTIGLQRAKEELHQRINSRIDQMIANGLVEEVRGLMNTGYDRQCPAMSGLGYRQIMLHLDGEISLAEAVDMLRRETIDFARRQIVWFSKYNANAQWFEMAEKPETAIIEVVRLWLEKADYAANT